MVKPVGFEPLSYERLKWQDIHRPIWNQCVLMGMEEIAQGVEVAGDSAKAETIRKNIETVALEFGNGATLDPTWFYLVAKKP